MRLAEFDGSTTIERSGSVSGMVAIRGQAEGWCAYAALGVALTVTLVPPSYALSDAANQELENAASNYAAPTNTLALENTVSYQPECDAPANREDAQYCDQREATKAVQDQARWAVWQFWIGVIGVIGVLVTLFFTAKAALAASKSALAAENAVSKSGEILDHAREATEKELRAYVTVRDLHLTDFGPEMVFKGRFQIENTGRTPAKSVRVVAGLATTPDADKQKFLFNEIPATNLVKEGRHVSGQSTIDIGAGVALPQSFTDTASPMTNGQFKLFEEGAWAVMIAGYISYRDIFGKQRRTIFRAVTGGDPKDGRVDLYASPKHNRST